MNTGVIILAGGRSSRMGTNKALLKINKKPSIERIAMCLSPMFSHLILVTNEPEAYRFLGLKTVSDHFPGKGPLAGIHAGLLASPAETNVIVACDMPFVSAELAGVLVNHSNEYDAVVPVIGGRQQPLFAVFKKKLAAKMEENIKSGCLRTKDLLAQLHVLYLTEQDFRVAGSLERIFFNMNRPHEYKEALQLAEKERPEN